MTLTDTIAAIATPPGTGGVGIIRVSGPGALEIAQRLFRTPSRTVLDPPLTSRTQREVHVGWLVDPQSGTLLDEVVLLVFHAPHSYTTEDVVEFQGHAGTAVIQRCLAVILAQGARLAAAGEFTKRAFLGGRVDLTRAEALADLTSARTEQALATALQQLDGKLAHALANLRAPLKHLLARIEASLDFPDEIDEPTPQDLQKTLHDWLEEARALIRTAEGGRLLREGATLAIVGRPNVGKSSLLNALLRAERAIVTDQAGTTRDVVEASLALHGVPFQILDTAGIRSHAADDAERLGIERSHDAMRRADLRLVVLEAHKPLADDDRALLQDAANAGATLAVFNKLDVAGSAPKLPEAAGLSALNVSARTGVGLAELEQAIYDLAVGQALMPVATVAINARHRAALGRACECLERASQNVNQALPVDLVAHDVSEALAQLGAITGTELREEVIDHIFASFCVGK